MSFANPELVSPGQKHGPGSSHGKTVLSVCCPCGTNNDSTKTEPIERLQQLLSQPYGTKEGTLWHCGHDDQCGFQTEEALQREVLCLPAPQIAEMNPSVGRSGCAYQGRGFQNMAQLTRHLRRTHQEKISRCLKCQQFFKEEIHNHVCRRTGMMRGEGQAKLWFSLFANLFKNAKPPQTPFYAEDGEASAPPNAQLPTQDIGTTPDLEVENGVDCIHNACPADPEVAGVSELENAVLQQIASLQSAVKLQGLQSATVRAQHLGHIYRSLISHTNILTSDHKSSESLEDTRSPESNAAIFTTQPPASQNIFSHPPSGAEPFPDLPEEVPFGEQDVYANVFSALDWDIEPLSSFPLPWTEQSGYI